MCGRYTVSKNPEDILAELGVDDWSDVEGYAPSYNIAPTCAAPVLFGAARRAVRLLRWGLVPQWAADAKGGARLINARSETVAEKPSFRHLVGRRHCLAIAEGYYEWQAERVTKQPFYIRRCDGNLLLLAALWDTWVDQAAAAAAAREGTEAPLLYTYTIITTSPSAHIAELHDRMPVVIEPADATTWLGRGGEEPQRAMDLLRPSAAALEYFPVSTQVNSVRNNGPSLCEPAALIEPDQPDLF